MLLLSQVILKAMFLCQIYKGITHLTLEVNADKGRQKATHALLTTPLSPHACQYGPHPG